MTAATPTHLDTTCAVLDGVSRLTVLLREHRHIPTPWVSVNPWGQVTVQLTAARTFDEPTRRRIVDELAAACHLDKPTAEGVRYSAENAHWVIVTSIKGEFCDRCDHCRGGHR